MLDAQQQRRSVLERLYHCETSLVAVGRASSAHPQGALDMIESADRFLRAALVAFEERWLEAELYEEEDAEAERQRLCGDYVAVLDEFTELLPILASATPHHVPIHLIPLMSAEITRVGASLNFDGVVLFSSYEYNYFVRTYDFEDLFGLIVRSCPHELKRRFLLLSIPRVERDSAPLHAVLLGHEINHVRTWATDPFVGLRVYVPSPDVDAAPTPAAKDAREEMFRERQVFWFHEFAADIYAALCYGPAALLSLGEVVGFVGPLDRDWPTHPSAARRLAITLRVLGKSGFYEVTDLQQHLAPYVASAQLDHPSAPLNEQIWPTVRDQLDALILKCEAAISPGERFVAARWPEVVSAADALAQGLPIGEVVRDGTRVAADPPLILNAAWLRKVGGLDGLAACLGLDVGRVSTTLKANAVLDQLVLKSFEIAATIPR